MADFKLEVPTAYDSKKQLRGEESCVKSKLISALALVLGFAALVGVCALVAVLVPKINSFQDAEEISEEQLHAQALNHQIAKRQGRNPNLGVSCYSNSTNDSLPIARIQARGIRWATRAPTTLDHPIPGFETSWTCNSEAFVEGGMNFIQEDDSLYFPKCGYYHISSQVLFQYRPTSTDSFNVKNKKLTVHHGVKVDSNCEDSIPEYRYGYSSLVRVTNMETSTYVSDIVKMCEGGSMRVFIPTFENLCCGQGDGMKTFFSAFLVQETDCP